MSDLKKQRDFISDKKIDQLEHTWWDENADIIAKVWEMNDDISWTARKNYIYKAINFIHDSKDTVTYLELGCGSGWVGQLLASSKTRILGIDFSKSQIELAKTNASRKGLENYCSYIETASDEWLPEFSEVDGVLIHCFLHHLSGTELEKIMNTLKKNLKKDTKIWIYEPAFYSFPNSKVMKPSLSSKLFWKSSHLMHTFLEKIYSLFNLVDQDISKPFLSLVNQARQNDWYLSPKEVPLNVEEFTNQLDQSFIVQNDYWATIDIIGAVQSTNLLKNSRFRKLVNAIFLQFIAFFDKNLCKDTNFIRNYLIAPNYGFHVWECISR